MSNPSSGAEGGLQIRRDNGVTSSSSAAARAMPPSPGRRQIQNHRGSTHLSLDCLRPFGPMASFGNSLGPGAPFAPGSSGPRGRPIVAAHARRHAGSEPGAGGGAVRGGDERAGEDPHRPEVRPEGRAGGAGGTRGAEDHGVHGLAAAAGSRVDSGGCCFVYRPGCAHDVQRITWTPLPDGRLRQHWEASKDGGATLTTSFNGL